MNRNHVVFDKARIAFEGVPSDVVKWLKDHPGAKKFGVYTGDISGVTTAVPEYLEEAEAVAQKKLRDKVFDLVMEATNRGRDSGDLLEDVNHITDQIMKLI